MNKDLEILYDKAFVLIQEQHGDISSSQLRKLLCDAFEFGQKDMKDFYDLMKGVKNER